MLRKDAVASRLSSDEGISYTEFSYQILQGMDYLQLFRDYGCALQTGGSDQWGNLTSGTELIRKVEGKSVHALGTPLITNSDGTKFGKSEGNAIWLDPEMCSPYAFYQFWLNTADADVVDRLKVFTFLSRAEIEELGQSVAERPLHAKARRSLRSRSPHWSMASTQPKRSSPLPQLYSATATSPFWTSAPRNQRRRNFRQRKSAPMVSESLTCSLPPVCPTASRQHAAP